MPTGDIFLSLYVHLYPISSPLTHTHTHTHCILSHFISTNRLQWLHSHYTHCIQQICVWILRHNLNLSYTNMRKTGKLAKKKTSVNEQELFKKNGWDLQLIKLNVKHAQGFSNNKVGVKSAAQQHKGTSDERSNTAEMKEEESLLQWDIETQQPEQNNTHVHERKYTCWWRRDVLIAQVVAYRAVEHALAIHGNVEAALHPLDGHHSQTHRNKIEKSCGEGRKRRRNRQKKRWHHSTCQHGSKASLFSKKNLSSIKNLPTGWTLTGK